MVNRNIMIWGLALIAIIGLFNLYQGSERTEEGSDVPYSEFLAHAEAGRLEQVVIDGSNIRAQLKDGQILKTYAPNDPDLISKLEATGVRIQAVPPDEGIPTLLAVLINWFPMLLFVGIWIFFMRQMQGNGRGAMGFGKSRAKMVDRENSTVNFDDVAGIDEAKYELSEIVEYLREPEKFQKLGGRIPKGVLLVGPPGTGKTLIARAVAGEAGVPFFSISGSDFVEMFVGVGASRVRDLFEQGKKASPCIIFIDEIDAVGRHRGAGLGGGNDEREQTLNQILVEMDGFEATESVILIAATNRPDVLDPALLRPGRFDRQVVVPSPDVKGRERILQVHMRNVPLTRDVNTRTIARGTPGFSGADLMNLVNEAALMAARRNRRRVTMREFEDAKDKVMMGSERRSLVMSEDEKKLTAYHEAGHAVVMLNVKGHEPLHKVTIIPRGRALGVTFALPERDKLSQSETELRAQLASLFGGRIAEEMIFGKENITTGASNDIQQATRIARRMVTEFGFSDKLGRLRYSDNEEEVFLGHSVAQRKNVSDATAKLIDEEVRLFVEEGEHQARAILHEHADQLEIIAQGLLEHETLNREDIDQLLRGEPLDSTEEDLPKAKQKAAFVPKAGKIKPKPKLDQAIPETGSA
ncbi:MAG: ATP-dependent zinc metalloprotease FtsH [Pseudomonadota bacterium]